MIKLISVLPISRGINKDSLSYFTGSDISIGSVVKVPVRKKNLPAIVIAVEEVSESKTELKNAPYEIKKISKIKSDFLLSADFIDTVKDSALYFATTAGSVLNSVVPKTIIDEVEKIKLIRPLTAALSIPASLVTEGGKKSRAHEKLILQSNEEERYATYKSLIREEFAKGYSVIFCLPTIQDIKKAQEKLSKGIEHYTFVLHGFLNKKEQVEIWNKAANEEHPVLIIATGSFLGIPRDDIGTIIIDEENSRSYKSQIRPFIDIRIFAEKLAKKIKAKIIFGDLLLRTETLSRQAQSELFEVAPLKFRSLTTANTKLINMKEILSSEITKAEKNKPTKNSTEFSSGKEPKFKLFSDDLLELINNNQSNDENMFIFVARRGLSPSTICADCGNLVKCNNCLAPAVLHKSTKENFFLCHRCGERRSALEKCQNCQSWRLFLLGIGIETVEEKIREKFPELKIFKIDSDSVSTHKKAIDTINKFYASPGSILLGTEMALLYFKEMIANTAVVSIDSLFSIPDIRINERIMNILLKIRAHTSRNFLIQTRDIDQKIFTYVAMGNLADFYRAEIKERETLDYPPFSILIKISLQGDKKAVLSGMEELQKNMLPYEMDVFPAFVPSPRGKYNMHGLIKIKRENWIDPILLEKLKSLSPVYTINVDPESLL